LGGQSNTAELARMTRDTEFNNESITYFYLVTLTDGSHW